LNFLKLENAMKKPVSVAIVLPELVWARAMPPPGVGENEKASESVPAAVWLWKSVCVGAVK
jgi:hypothetical protein